MNAIEIGLNWGTAIALFLSAIIVYVWRAYKKQEEEEDMAEICEIDQLIVDLRKQNSLLREAANRYAAFTKTGKAGTLKDGEEIAYFNLEEYNRCIEDTSKIINEVNSDVQKGRG